jgi:hypothetical protein
VRIVHRYTVNAGDRERADLRRAEVEIGSGFVTFELDEADPRWPAVDSWAAERKPVDLVRTEWTTSEIDAADWLTLRPDWHHGYPQPEEGFGYLDATYDRSDACDACAIGLRQKAPFRMKAEPRWGSRGILQLNWVFDEFFVRPDAWRDVFAPLGVARRPVLDPAGKELGTIVQLVVDDEVALDITRPGEVCSACGRVRYPPPNRGPLPALAGQPRGHLARSEQWFGSGASSWRLILVSRDLARATRAARLKGASLAPMGALPDASPPRRRSPGS